MKENILVTIVDNNKIKTILIQLIYFSYNNLVIVIYNKINIFYLVIF